MIKTVQQALFSMGLELPRFIALECKSEEYEMRRYQTTNWVSTSVSGMQYDPALNTGFMRLFRYIQGSNGNQEKIEMTAPVTCLVDPGVGPACEATFTISFLVPEKHQADPPQPADPLVFIENRKQFTAYVRTYGGFSNEQRSREELLKLTECLQRDGLEFVDKPYYTAGYDSPFKLLNRRNEVWLLQKTP
ncbi:heme-binding protein 2-like [Arapaima gigas]